MTDFDSVTGMPLVPENYFWRVRTKQTEFDYNPVVVVELRERSPRWYSKNRSVVLAKVERSTNDAKKYIGWRGYEVPFAVEVVDMNEAIVNAALDVYDKHKDFLLAIDRSARLDAALKTVVRDYPPKKLEAK